MKKKLVYIALAVFSAAILIYSCSKSSSTPKPAQTVGSVSIKNMAFIPDTLRIKAGTTVTWSNLDAMTHTVTATPDAFNSGNLGAGLNFQFTFSTAGTYNYHCAIHPTMVAVVIVN